MTEHASDREDQRVLRIYVNKNITMSKGKYASQAVHAALFAMGIDHTYAVAVLGASPTKLKQMKHVVTDEGITEITPGSTTAASNWPDDAYYE